ncbi:DoxX family protein [Pontibacter qinzhouensis]|uniref:DoxX family protein n=1 Tax=Pontibacter qinzhouensis TaxID=2603253 RepID=A0A5C8K899_9BACT|nr:DoxX family protein [Pontibacter qinzhouensis]
MQGRQSGTGWSETEKIAFRFFAIYFFLQAVPLDWKYFQKLLSVNWLDLHFRDIFYISRYTPRFFSGEAAGWGIGTFTDWAGIAVVAAIGAAFWTYRDRDSQGYKRLYYSLRVLLRYRLAAALLAYGFIKFFPMQMPYPSLSNLNTNYGDLTAWKIFAMSAGIVPGYQSFLGLVEILGALFLLHRKTTIIGLLIILPFHGNVFMSNLAYEGGEHVYSLYLISIALFLLAYDVPRLYDLLVLQRPAKPSSLKPVFTAGYLKTSRLLLKTAFIFFFVFVYGYKTYASYRTGPYHYPATPGLANAAGLYNVSEFRLNGQPIPYSKTDPQRWQDVVFEEWSTLSIKSNRPVQLETADTEEIAGEQEARPYEEAGAAGRHYYQYTVDTAQKVLVLENKNRHHQGEKFTLKYTRPAATRIILSGVNEQQDSVYVVLDKLDKKYLLEEVDKRGGRRGEFKL